MGSTADGGSEIPQEALNVADATGLPSSAMGTHPEVPEGTVPSGEAGRTPKPPGPVSPMDVAASPPVSPQKKPDEEEDEESVEQLAKRARLDEQKSEMKSVLRKFLKISKMLEVASEALTSTNSQLKDNTTELDRLSNQLGSTWPRPGQCQVATGHLADFHK